MSSSSHEYGAWQSRPDWCMTPATRQEPLWTLTWRIRALPTSLEFPSVMNPVKCIRSLFVTLEACYRHGDETIWQYGEINKTYWESNIKCYEIDILTAEQLFANDKLFFFCFVIMDNNTQKDTKYGKKKKSIMIRIQRAGSFLIVFLSSDL